MDFVLPVVASMIMLVLVLIAFAAVVKIQPFFYDYRFRREGIDFVILGGRIVIWHIDIERIREVRIITVKEAILYTQMTFHMGNRLMQRTGLLVKLRGFPYVMTLTPSNPEEAVDALGLPRRYGMR